MRVLTTTTLAQRLRRDTGDDHRRAEAASGLPSSVTSVANYGALLHRLRNCHSEVEAALADDRWAAEWPRIGIRLGDHTRSNLLDADLRDLQVFRDRRAASRLQPLSARVSIGTFGGALGHLYVLEGSSLGGGILGPLLRASLGPVPTRSGLLPTRFYDGEGRNQPHPWRSVQEAVQAYETDGGDPEPVVQGARHAFAMFAERLDSTLWSSIS